MKDCVGAGAACVGDCVGAGAACVRYCVGAGAACEINGIQLD